MSGVHCHVRTSSTSGCAFVYCTTQYYIEYRVQNLYFKPRMSGSTCKSSSGIAGITAFLRYYTVRLNTFSLWLCLFFTYYLCEKHYNPIVAQYYVVDCVSWIPRLTLLDFQTNWTYEHALGMELVHMWGTYFTQLEVAPGNVVWPQMLLYPGALLINRFYFCLMVETWT